MLFKGNLTFWKQSYYRLDFRLWDSLVRIIMLYKCSFPKRSKSEAESVLLNCSAVILSNRNNSLNNNKNNVSSSWAINLIHSKRDRDSDSLILFILRYSMIWIWPKPGPIDRYGVKVDSLSFDKVEVNICASFYVKLCGNLALFNRHYVGFLKKYVFAFVWCS